MSGELAGALRERVTIEQPNPARDALGGRTGGYLYDGAAWAAITPLMPAGLTAAEALSALARWSVSLRKREGIVPGTRLVWRGRYLRVRSVVSDPQAPAQMVLSCEEVR